MWRWLIYLLALGAAACLPALDAQRAAPSGRIIYGLTLQPSGFDPHIHRSSELGIPLRQVYDTLVYRDPQTDAFVPGLAESWIISDDGLVYTFTLRQGVTFHDGTPFNAQAVGANLDRIVNPETASQRAIFMLGPYERYEIPDAYTIRLILSAPYSPLLDSLAQVYLGIASPTALASYSNNRYQFHQVGTGPFRFVEYVPGNRVVIERNPDYAWGPSFYRPITEQSIAVVEFRFFEDPPTRSLSLESGDTQIMGELLPTDARAFTGNSAIRLLPVSIPGQPLQFFMNTNRFPTDNRATRQALLFGTNRNAIIDGIFQRFSPVAWGPLSASTLYYNPQMNGLYNFDLIQAQSLLASAGYADSNGDGVLDIGGVDVVVDIIVPPWGLLPQVAELLRDQWLTLGIRTNLIPVPTFPALLEAVQSGAYNLVAFDTPGLDPALLNSYYLSDGVNNWTGFQNDTLDDLLNQAVITVDEATRRSLYGRVQQLIMDEALILPIRDYVNLNASSARLDGLSFDPYGWFPLLHNAFWAQ